MTDAEAQTADETEFYVDLFLDVDGVINAVSPRDDIEDIAARTGWRDYRRKRVLGYVITYSQEFIDRLNALAELPHVRIHWLTTWSQHAVDDLCPALGIEGTEWVVLNQRDFDSFKQRVWWKLTAIRSMTSDLALWIDDDLAFDREAREWIDENEHIVPVCPNTENGITEPQWRKVEEIAKITERHNAALATATKRYIDTFHERAFGG